MTKRERYTETDEKKFEADVVALLVLELRAREARNQITAMYLEAKAEREKAAATKARACGAGRR